MDYSEMSDKELWELTSDADDRIKLEALYTLAQRLFNRGEYPEVISPGLAGVDLAQRDGDSSLEIDLSYFLGKSYVALKRYDEGLAQLTPAIEKARIHASEQVLAEMIKASAEAQRQLDLIDEAASNYRAASNIFLSNDMKTPAGICLLDLGEMLGQEDRQSEALGVITEALKVFQDGADLIGSGRANDRIAACLIDLGRIDEALVNLREANNIFSYMQDEGRLPWSQYRLGWTLVTVGQYAEAQPLLISASEKYKAKSNFVAAANADVQLAHAFYETGRHEEAFALYEQTRSVYLAAGELSDALMADINSAQRLRYVDSALAQEKLLRVIREGSDSSSHWIVRSAKLRLAECLLDNEESTANAEQAFKYLEEISVEAIGDNRPELARLLTAKAKALYKMGRIKDAEDIAKQVVEFGIGAGFQYESAQAHELLSMAAFERDELERSDEMVARAIAFYLAAGIDYKATELSKRFLPNNLPAMSVRIAAEADSMQSLNEEDSQKHE
jgi:tetratricopeptide (TPR) repeat protein